MPEQPSFVLMLISISILGGLFFLFAWLFFRQKKQTAQYKNLYFAEQRSIEDIKRQDTIRLAILENLPDPLLTLDHQMIVVRSNKAARALFGEEVQEKSVATFWRDATVLEALNHALQQESAQTAEYHRLQPTEQYWQVLIEPLPKQPHARTRLVVTLNDHTSNKLAQRANADFVANASHELRTPLTSLLGFIETLQGAAKEDANARQHFLTIMHDEAERMRRLVSDLLSLSRIERNLHSTPEETIVLHDLLEDVTDTLQLKASQKNMLFALENAPLTATVQGDGDELMQVFLNLVDNAIKYGEKNTTITIRYKNIPHTKNCCIEIHNTGDGIAAEDIPRLTERFYRGRTARASGENGTGLGLAIVKHILSRHHGTLEIDSVLGSYATFKVTLPLL